jgi:hypothetical protein
MEWNDADPMGDPSDLSETRHRKFTAGGEGIIFLESLTVTRRSHARIPKMSIREQNAEGLQRVIRAMRKINKDSLILFQTN